MNINQMNNWTSSRKREAVNSMNKTRASQYPKPPDEPFDINNKAHRDLFRGYVAARILDTMDMLEEWKKKNDDKRAAPKA